MPAGMGGGAMSGGCRGTCQRHDGHAHRPDYGAGEAFCGRCSWTYRRLGNRSCPCCGTTLRRNTHDVRCAAQQALDGGAA